MDVSPMALTVNDLMGCFQSYRSQNNANASLAIQDGLWVGNGILRCHCLKKSWINVSKIYGEGMEREASLMPVY